MKNLEFFSLISYDFISGTLSIHKREYAYNFFKLHYQNKSLNSL